MSKFGKFVELVLFLISLNLIFLQLEFSDNDRFKAGVHVKAVLTSLNTAFLPFCHVLSNAKSLCLFP